MFGGCGCLDRLQTGLSANLTHFRTPPVGGLDLSEIKLRLKFVLPASKISIFVFVY